MGWKEYFLLKLSIITYGKEERHRTSPFRKYNSNRCCRRDPLMDAKISRQMFEEKQDLHSIKVFTPRYLSTIQYIKGKHVTL